MTCSCNSLQGRRAWAVVRRAMLPLALLVTLGSSGCVKLSPSGTRLEGEWVGRVRSVTAWDEAGREFEAAALSIEHGPRTFDVVGTGPYT
jgi:hypothetical protein